MNFRLVLFIMLYRAGLTFKFVNETLVRNGIQTKVTEKDFHVVLFIMLLCCTNWF